jgi:regulator of replication initiation timing
MSKELKDVASKDYFTKRVATLEEDLKNYETNLSKAEDEVVQSKHELDKAMNEVYMRRKENANLRALLPDEFVEHVAGRQDEPLLGQLDPERIYKAIQDGVHDAIWQMITNNTDMPCADFYDTVKSAATKAFSEMEKP